MGKALLADGSAADAYVEYDFGSAKAEVWVTFGLAFGAAALALWQSGTFADLCELLKADHATVLDEVYIDGSGWEWGGNFGNVPPPVSGAWQTCELHDKSDGTSALYVGGTLVGTGDRGVHGVGVRYFRLGIIGGSPNPVMVSYFDNVKVGTTRGAADLFSDNFESGDLSAWTTTSGAVSVVADPYPSSGTRIDLGNLWRFVVADLDCKTLTFLDKLAESRMVTYTLNAPAVATGNVPSDNPEVNIPASPGSLTADPFVSYADRILFGFRREGGVPPWRIRFAGLLLQLEDAASTDVATSAYTAYDPWQYLFSRPIRKDDLTLPGKDGITFDGGSTTLDAIAVGFIANTILADGNVFVDTGAGTIENVPFSGTINFQQGTSVGDALTQLCNTGELDIWFSPVYDPVARPGIIADLNIYVQQGATRNSAIFAWDSPSKSLVGISRLLDGAQLANKIQFYNGQGGPPVALQTDAASVAKYGEYWAQQFFPAQVDAPAVVAMAAQQLVLRNLGRRTLAVNPAPERSPDPFTEYFLGDLVPVYATKRLRQTLPAPGESTNYQRVYGIPLAISDNALESVAQLLTSPDGFTP